MKKFITLIICILLLLSASACKTSVSKPSDNSSKPNTENSISLIRALRGTDNIFIIKSLSIVHEYGADKTEITDSNDWTFLGKYTYSHIYPSEELSVLFTFPGTNIIQIDNSGEQLYLMKDGSIVKQEMCGDSEVTNRTYEVYQAEEKYMLNEEKLITLLKKYDNSITDKTR